MQTIVVPVDFSKPSENALKLAADLAKRNNFKMIVLHVMEIDDPVMGSEQYYVDDRKMLFFMKLAGEKFNRFLDRDYLKELEITDLVEIGTTVHGIVHTLEKYHANLIVMGATGAGGTTSTLGSTTEKVIRNAEIPVLILKNDLKKIPLRKIVFASDFSLENLPAYRKTQQFTDDFHAELKLIYVNTPGEHFKSSQEIDEKIRHFLHETETSYDPENVIVHSDYSIEQGVLNAAHVHSADLIVMPTHGRKGLAHFFSGSIAEDVTNHSTLPVLTFKITEQE